MKIDADIALEVASHEGIVRQAYKDSVGTWTWSIGITNATGHNVDQYIGNPQPMQKCLEVYVWALEKYAQAVREAFVGRDLTREQFAAALSFHYNTGAIKRATWVQLWKDGRVSEARAAFMSWNKPAEIIGRRTKERDLFFDGKWSNTGLITEYGVTAAHTPDWKSGKRVNIRQDMAAAFGGTASVLAPSTWSWAGIAFVGAAAAGVIAFIVSRLM